MRNRRVLKLIWVLAQGLFLPLVLYLDDARVSGEYGMMLMIFLFLEALYMADAWLLLLWLEGRK